MFIHPWKTGERVRQDANIAGNVHGGNIMKLADTASAVVAIRHSDPGPPDPSGDRRRPSTKHGGSVARRDQEKTNIACPPYREAED
ncbi:MAG: hotdog domain-containing protein [Candidatus Deferrimicrobiaceae bacterium]